MYMYIEYACVSIPTRLVALQVILFAVSRWHNIITIKYAKITGIGVCVSYIANWFSHDMASSSLTLSINQPAASSRSVCDWNVFWTFDKYIRSAMNKENMRLMLTWSQYDLYVDVYKCVWWSRNLKIILLRAQGATSVQDLIGVVVDVGMLQLLLCFCTSHFRRHRMIKSHINKFRFQLYMCGVFLCAFSSN